MSMVRRAVSRRRFAGVAGAGVAAMTGGVPVRKRQATPAIPSDAAWETVIESVASIAPRTTLLASEVSDGEIAVIASHHPEQIQAVGSSFKLYVLATLGAQVREGLLDWGQAVEIQGQYRSVPGGDLRYAFEGTPLTLRYVAERMIQKSDNTATDHAIAVAGREAVEAMFATAGHASPERNVPLMTTREFAFLKLLYPDLEGYLAADVEQRRAILEHELPQLDYDDLLAAAERQQAPLHIDTVEWFASAMDLTRAMAMMLTMAKSDIVLQPLLEIMALETPIPLAGETWPYAGFKGGSEMGVLHGTWLLRRHDGRWFVLSIGFNDRERALDMDAAIGTMVSAFDVLVEAP